MSRRAPVTLLPLFAAFALAWAAAGARPHRILILGDSLTEGYGVEKDSAFPALLERELRATDTAYHVFNAGSSGSTSASGLSRLKWYARLRPEVVLLALGSNDGLRGVPVEDTRRNVQACIDYARAQGWRVYLAGLRLPPNYGPEYTRAFARAFQDLAKANRLPLYGFLLAGVAGDPALNQEDGIHPNEKGHAIIAANLYAFFRQELK